MNVVKIPLTQKKFAIIDVEDLPLISAHKWTYDYKGYAYRVRNKKTLYMHRFLLNAPPGVLVDHKNGNGLDNRRCNIRLCTKSQNAMNTPKYSIKGAYLMNRNLTKPWRADIKINGKRRTIGYFKTQLEAALAYDTEAKKLFGEFARSNFVEI